MLNLYSDDKQRFSHLTMLLGLAWMLTFTAALPPARAQAPDAPVAHLPLAMHNPSTHARLSATPVQAAFFIDTQYRTSTASIQVDAAGGLHLAYNYYEPVGEGVPTYGVYLYCAAACEDGANWSGVGLGEQVNEVQLKLTPAGQPRVLFRARAADEDRNDYFYAACDQTCTDPVQWTVTYLVSNWGTAPICIKVTPKDF